MILARVKEYVLRAKTVLAGSAKAVAKKYAFSAMVPENAIRVLEPEKDPAVILVIPATAQRYVTTAPMEREIAVSAKEIHCAIFAQVMPAVSSAVVTVDIPKKKRPLLATTYGKKTVKPAMEPV